MAGCFSCLPFLVVYWVGTNIVSELHSYLDGVFNKCALRDTAGKISAREILLRLGVGHNSLLS